MPGHFYSEHDGEDDPYNPLRTQEIEDVPLYLYSCPKHGEFENLSAKVDDLPRPCPECGKQSPQIPAVPSPMRWSPKTGGWN